MNLQKAITDVPGIKVGHAQDMDAFTGCTVVICEGGAIGGIDQRGGAPGTRQIDSLSPMRLVQEVHAVLLSGGSAFGLDAAGGVVKYLEEKGVGLDVGTARVPIVPTAILFDLAIGRADVRPDARMGYQACLNATSDPPEQGNVGAGCGATLGKILGMEQAMKSGIGTASMDIGNGLIVGAIVAVNPFGDVIDPQTGGIIAGARAFQSDEVPPQADGRFADTMKVFKLFSGTGLPGFGQQGNTVIGVVATNAKLTKEGVNKVAQMAHAGLARCVRPANTMLDGDTIFALGTGEQDGDANIVGAFSAEVFAQATINAVKAAQPAGGLPSAASLYSGNN